MRTGTATAPLHHGKAPKWLFDRMRDLASEISRIIVQEYGREEFLRRLSDPFWFQSLACVLGFDWHSSGASTTACGALKEGLRPYQRELGIFVTGGKGATSRKTPSEIENIGYRYSVSCAPKMIYASKMSAKVDNTAIQDGFQLYHHTFVFTPEGHWAVIQQGMNTEVKRARRYHWLSYKLRDFVEEPHAAICSDSRQKSVLDLTATKSRETRDITTALSRNSTNEFLKDLGRIQELSRERRLILPDHHPVLLEDFNHKFLLKTLSIVREKCPKNFEALLGIRGVGPKTIRALTLVSEVVHGTKPSFKDPVRYSFAHGGKDGYPYPVDRPTYDKSISILKKALEKAKIGHTEKLGALKRLSRYSS